MATNKILAFSTDNTGIYSMTDADYLADASGVRTLGAVKGLAQFKQFNKVAKQTSLLAAGLAQFIADRQANEINDQLTPAQIATYLQASIIPVGTKAWFYQDTAPAGWSIVAGCADGLLAVKGGEQAYNVAGGAQAGVWTQPNHAHSHAHLGPLHTHTGPPHVHGNGTHAHDVTIPIGNNWNEYGSSDEIDAGVNDNFGKLLTVRNSLSIGIWHQATKTPTVQTAQGGSGITFSAGDGLTGASGSAATSADATAGATANTWRPLANVGIICSKD